MPLITITRSLGCAGSVLARRVADNLGVELYDDNALEERARKMEFDLEGVGPLSEWAPGFFDQLLGSRPQVYLDVVQAVVYEAARHGTGVILGHGSQLLLRDFGCALHVRVFAPEEFRVRHLAERHGLTPDVAERQIRKSDHEQRGFLRFAFRMDWNDPSLYDLVINREKLSVDLAAELICAAARSKEIQECTADALESMERLSLSRRVEAALLEASNETRHIFVEVQTKGHVHLTGVAHETEVRERAAQVASEVPGVIAVQNDVITVRRSAV